MRPARDFHPITGAPAGAGWLLKYDRRPKRGTTMQREKKGPGDVPFKSMLTLMPGSAAK